LGSDCQQNGNRIDRDRSKPLTMIGGYSHHSIPTSSSRYAAGYIELSRERRHAPSALPLAALALTARGLGPDVVGWMVNFQGSRNLVFVTTKYPHQRIGQPIAALLPRDESGFHFLLYGDCCSGVPGAPHESTFASVNSVVGRIWPPPEFICFLGDEISGRTADYEVLRAQWKHWLEYEMAWLDREAIPHFSDSNCRFWPSAARCGQFPVSTLS
jgi:hypothetical protein